ncbi:lipocalin-like domain-containing protein [Azospirillum sp. sgz302134]
MTTMPERNPMALVGTWTLREAYAWDDKGGHLENVYGRSPTGFISYGADGRMMALITHGERARLDGDRQSAPAEQRAAAYASSVAYAGTYEFDGERVVHHVKASTYPNWVGTDLVRFVRFGEDHISLRTAPQMQNGVRSVLELIWQPVGATIRPHS